MKFEERRVYFARCLSPHHTPIGAIKIGCSYVHEERLSAIARNQPYTLELITSVPGDMMTEAMCHVHLRRHRISGEFFHENQVVMRFVDAAQACGRAFYYVEDAGSWDLMPTKAIEAFMDYHDVTLEEACEVLEIDPARFRGKLNGLRNRRLVAAIALVAQSDRRFVNWPIDCVHGLLGSKHPHLTPRLEAPDDEEELEQAAA